MIFIFLIDLYRVTTTTAQFGENRQMMPAKMFPIRDTEHDDQTTTLGLAAYFYQTGTSLFYNNKQLKD